MIDVGHAESQLAPSHESSSVLGPCRFGVCGADAVGVEPDSTTTAHRFFHFGLPEMGLGHHLKTRRRMGLWGSGVSRDTG